MHSDKKIDTHCQKIRHLRFYVIFYLIENELNKTLARYLNALLRIKENNMNKKNLLRLKSITRSSLRYLGEAFL